MLESKKANGFVIFILVMIIMIALIGVIALYFDIDFNDVKGYFYGKPDYNFNDKSNVFIDKLVFNKMKFAYDKLEDGEILCLYGIEKNNGDVLIDDIKESTSNNLCNENNEYLGNMYINKNYVNDVYDINCGLSKEQIESLNIQYNTITGIMCKSTWFGFYNNESIDTSYNYNIVN